MRTLLAILLLAVLSQAGCHSTETKTAYEETPCRVYWTADGSTLVCSAHVSHKTE
jgi:hypothetical protein